jgi:hypothetical protein
MSQTPVKRLHQDLQRLADAKRAHQQDNRELHRDERELKSDRKAHQRQHDKFEKNAKQLGQERAKLSKLLDAEKSKLAPLQAQAQQLQAQYDASVDPTTGQGDASTQAQLGAVQQQEASVQASYGARIEPERAEVDKLKAAVAQGRATLQGLRGEIRKERSEVKHGRKAVAHDASKEKADRKKALKDLRPAEYKMGLQATNKARASLGLKKVDHVIRPGVPNVVGGQVGKWIAEAQTILKQHGIPLSKMNARDINIIIQHESSGNPNAVNNWDSNAAAGHPSEGLMQTIGPTFDSYKLPGHGKILNPVDNIIAGVRYAISRYGSISNVPGVRAVHAGGAYVGY